MTLGYLCAIGVAVLFMMYLDGEIGVMMLAFLLVMPILSVAVTLLVKHSLTVSMELPENTAKMKPVTLKIVLEKKSVLPLPFLRMELNADEHFMPLDPLAEPVPDEPTQAGGFFGYLKYLSDMKKWRRMLPKNSAPDKLFYRLSMGTEKKKVIEVPVCGEFCGKGTLTLTKRELSDFILMLRFKLKKDITASLLILPSIPDEKTGSELFRAVSNESLTSDDESESNPTGSAATTAGYEHRDYVAGDSLKRINWKLSSKRRKLMVRMDEPIALTKLMAVLDFERAAGNCSPRDTVRYEQLVIEDCLGKLKLFTAQGFPCTLWYQDETERWTGVQLDSPEQVDSEAVTLLRGGFHTRVRFHAAGEAPKDDFGTEPIPNVLTQDSGSIVLYYASHMTKSKAARLDALPLASLYLMMPDYADCFTPPPLCCPEKGQHYTLEMTQN